MAKKDWMVSESELDDDQIRVLQATLDKSCIVSGCAGSGKSVLALIKAQRIQNERGNNYKIIVFTKALCQYMNAGREELGLKNDFVYHWRWANRLGKPGADYIIVDEIQDFSEDEIQDFIKATNKHFFFFGDTAQSIYEGLKTTLPVERIHYMLPNDKMGKTFELYRNYRLPRPVAKVVQYVGVDLGGFDIDTYKSPETAIPRIIQYNSYGDQIKAITDMVDKGRVSDVGIFVPTNDDVQNLFDQLTANGINCEYKAGMTDTLNFNTENVKIMTYHSAKGLQFGTVILPGVTNKEFAKDKKALYVAMTRTYRNLYVMYSGSMPSPLDEIPSELYKTTETDTIDDI